MGVAINSKAILLSLIVVFSLLPGVLAQEHEHSTTPLSASDLDIWTHNTMIVIIATLFVGAMMVQLGRSYFLRVLKKFTLRLGADLWWLTFILVRDGLMFGSFLMGLLYLHAHIYTIIPLAMPFAPLSVVLMAAAFLIKLIKDADEERGANDAVTLLVVLAAIFNMINLILFIEAGSGEPFTTFNMLFSSIQNPGLAMASWNVSMGLLSLLGLIAIVHVWRLDRKVASPRPNSTYSISSKTINSKKVSIDLRRKQKRGG